MGEISNKFLNEMTRVKQCFKEEINYTKFSFYVRGAVNIGKLSGLNSSKIF